MTEMALYAHFPAAGGAGGDLVSHCNRLREVFAGGAGGELASA